MIGAILGAVGGFFGKREERKRARESGEAKIKLKQIEGDHKVEMSRAEWEAVSKKGELDSWKDEYVTVIMTLPIPLIFIGALYAGFYGDATILEAVEKALDKLGNLLDTGYGAIVETVVYAAVGIRFLKGITK